MAMAVKDHDTRGMAVANALAALDFGIQTFDASAGGLGGCPFAPGASGNVRTESLLYLLKGLGYSIDIRADTVTSAVNTLGIPTGKLTI